MLVGLATPLFFRKRAKSGARNEAYEELFTALEQTYAAVAAMRPEWESAWEERSRQPLPPRFEPETYRLPNAGQVIQDMRFAQALLGRNRWKSKAAPLFLDLPDFAWRDVRLRFEQLARTVVAAREEHVDDLFSDEIDALDKATEAFDNIRYQLLENERADMPEHQKYAISTFAILLASTELSSKLVERLRREAEGEL
jgi:hypothetical protein